MAANGTSGNLPERFPPTNISVLIVGGGVAGLLAALECWRKWHDVRIVERSPERVQSGDVLTVRQSAVRAFKQWPDMAEENDRISHEMWISWHKINGDLLAGPAQLRPNDPKPRSDGGPVEPTPNILRHRRQAIHKMLSDQVERAGMKVEYGRQVVQYKEDDSKAYAVLQDGQVLEADVVIAADGIGSKSYMITLGHEVRAKPTGFSMYRAMLPIEQALVDPIIDEKFPKLDNKRASNQIWMGGVIWSNVYVMFGRTEADIIWYITYPNRGSSEESWSNLADPETVLETTATIEGWPEYANRLIKATKNDQVHDFKLMWRDPQPCWVSPKGRVVQIGDAAHTFLPSSGHGATQGMEDAVSLATCLQIAGKENVPMATRVHNKLRFERVSCLQLLGILNHELRNRASNADASQAKPIGIMGSWIWQHNPETYTNQIKTVDGVTLRGWLFKGPKNGPAIIVNGAFNAPKEIFVAAVAEWFGRNGVTALVYDYRSIGASDGLPRNDLDPQKMAEDNHDAVTFLQDNGWVDSKKIAVWGFFYSSMIAIEAAAYDKRVAAVISQGLMPEWYLDPVTEQDTIAQAIEDRANQVRGDPPTYIPLVNEKGEHLMHLKYLANMTEEQKKNLPKWVEGARKHAPSFVDKMTIQSFYRHAKWKPLNNIHLLAPTPVMILTPENDEIVPPAYQKNIFDSLASEQKRYEIVKDRGHMNFLADVNFDVLLAGQLAFLKDVLKF